MAKHEQHGAAHEDRMAAAAAMAASAAYVLIGGEMASYGPVLPEWMREFNVGPATVGTVFSAAAAGSLAATVTFPWLRKRLGIGRVLGLGSLVFGAALVAVSFARSYPAMAASLVVVGFGFAAIDVGVNTLCVALFSDRRGLWLNLVHLFFAAGAAITPFILPLVLPVTGWRAVYLGFAAAAAVVAVALARTGPAERRAVAPASQSSAAPAAPADRATVLPGRAGGPGAVPMTVRVLAGPIVAMLLYVGAELSVTGWAFSYLLDEAGASAGLAGAGVSIFWAGLAVGRLAFAPVVEALGYRVAAVLGAVIGGAALVAFAWVASPILAATLLGISGLAVATIFPTLVALATRMVPDSEPAFVMSIMVFASTAGSMLLPAASGALAEWLSLRTAMVVMGLLLAGGCAAALARRHPVPEVPQPAAVTTPGPASAHPIAGRSRGRPAC